ncbi:MAG: SUMF1/EgtB/PvdO family nonheme iron enzyme, partial [Pseudomonadota bacterium]
MSAQTVFTPTAEPDGSFSDPMRGGGDGPVMIALPAGAFRMGELDPARSRAEPLSVRIPRPFALARHAATFEAYDRFCAAAGAPRADDQGWGRGDRPAVDVSWWSARDYCAWLSEQTGARYRLPSEAEWEYACRAGTGTAFSTGDAITTEQANFDPSQGEGEARGRTLPVNALPPNPWGLHQMHGNVGEWCDDCWSPSLAPEIAEAAPWRDPEPWERGL